MRCFLCFGSKAEEMHKDSHPTSSDKVKSSSNFIAKKEKEKVDIKKQPYDQSAPQTFTFRELAAATNNFMPESFIGEGGYGRVYKGTLKNTGQVVAVKQLDRDGLQGNREFLVEVLTLSLLHHSNLVNLIGYCADGDQRLLVYEFMPLGSLEDHVHDLPPDKEPLDWKTRMKIAAGAAKGLEYLHDKANPPIIYRDFKSSNILLGEGFHPKLSDFGLAKLGPVGDVSYISEQVAGTYGYWAPDYAKTGRLTVQSDVYSFGVVLLELITGRKAFDSTRPQGQRNLVAWARPLFLDQKKFATLADPRLQGQYPMRGLYQAVAVASMCIQEEGAARPLIRNVAAALSNLANHVYELSSAPGHGYRLCEDRGVALTKMAFHGTSKAIAAEAWSELVHSVVSWTPPRDMSMEYYYTLPEDNSNRLDVYKYKLGAENIEARIKSGLHSQVVQANEHEYHQGIENIQDCIRSINDDYVVKANEGEDQQGIEYVRDCVRSTNDYYVVEANEGENQQGIEDIQACMRSTNRYDVVQGDEQGNQQEIEPAQHSIGSFKPNPAKNEDHQSISNIREFMRSQGLPKVLPEPGTGSQPRISYEKVKKMSTLFDDLFEFIENYNMHGVEKPTLRFQVLELIKLLHHYGIDTIRSGVEEQLEYVNRRNDATGKNSARHYKKALEVMLRICDTGTCQSTIYEIIGKAERDQVLYEW